MSQSCSVLSWARARRERATLKKWNICAAMPGRLGAAQTAWEETCAIDCVIVLTFHLVMGLSFRILSVDVCAIPCFILKTNSFEATHHG